jgi:hypothetical protein
MFLILYFNFIVTVTLLPPNIVPLKTISYGAEEGGASEIVFGLNTKGLKTVITIGVIS